MISPFDSDGTLARSHGPLSKIAFDANALYQDIHNAVNNGDARLSGLDQLLDYTAKEARAVTVLASRLSGHIKTNAAIARDILPTIRDLQFELESGQRWIGLADVRPLAQDHAAFQSRLRALHKDIDAVNDTLRPTLHKMSQQAEQILTDIAERKREEEANRTHDRFNSQSHYTPRSAPRDNGIRPRFYEDRRPDGSIWPSLGQ